LANCISPRPTPKLVYAMAMRRPAMAAVCMPDVVRQRPVSCGDPGLSGPAATPGAAAAAVGLAMLGCGDAGLRRGSLLLLLLLLLLCLLCHCRGGG
jgi:hypothetical protein